MDVVSPDVLRRVAGVVEREFSGEGTTLHTITFELNGAHGGVDVTFLGERYSYAKGFEGWDNLEETRIFGCAAIPDGTLNEAMR